MSTPRQRSSSASSTPKKRNGKVPVTPIVPLQAPAPHPAPNDRDGWRAHWSAQGHPWRTEPEIDQKRQVALAQHRAIVPDIEKGVYPFKGMKLTRADVEWLLATHENGRGPVDWSDKNQQDREGLDLRGASLRKANLSQLPLAKMRGGLTAQERLATTLPQRHMAAVHLEQANLTQIHLEEATLRNAHFEQTNLEQAHLVMADCAAAHFEGAFLRSSHLDGANLQRAYFDAGTFLDDISLGNKDIGYILLCDARWNGANLATIQWQQMRMSGEEGIIQQTHTMNERMIVKFPRLLEYQSAVRANRQLAIELQQQGLSEDAARFAYRAQVLQKKVVRLQMLLSNISFRQRMQALGSWLFSWFLFLLAGYGYKPGRSFLAYLLVIGTFMALYLRLDLHLAWYEALVVSMTAFHGRGFSPSTFSPGDPLSIASAIEAFVGLIIEVTFIATLTQRFFNR